MLAQAIEAKTGLQVERRFDLGGNLAHQAMIAGEIDVYVEYTGTALLAISKKNRINDPPEVYRQVKSSTSNSSARMDRAAGLQQYLCDSGSRR